MPVPPAGWVPLKRAALAKVPGDPALHLRKGQLVMVVPTRSNSWRAVVDVRVGGKLMRGSVPTDAVDPGWQKALRRAEVVARRIPLLADRDGRPSVGRLGDLMPELAAWIAAGLGEQDETVAAAHIEQMEVRACWRGLSDNYNLSPLSRTERPLIFGDPDRRQIRLPQPRGVPKRGWQVGVQIVRGEVLEIGVVRPTILRPILDRIAKVADALGDPPTSQRSRR
jgi:hypothetical protein